MNLQRYYDGLSARLQRAFGRRAGRTDHSSRFWQRWAQFVKHWRQGTEAQQASTALYDVNADCLEVHGNGRDSAPNLVLRGATPEQVCATLLEVLRQGFGLTNSEGPCMLSMRIGPAGTGNDMTR